MTTIGTAEGRRSTRRAAPAVWIVAPFINFTYAADGGRYGYLATRASRAGADVTLFTSGFDHHTKRRKPRPSMPGVRCVRVYEPGYRQNVSVRRIVSHAVFDCCLFVTALWTALTRGRPHSILCPLPHNGGAVLLGLLAKCLGSRFIVDVHDTWPESILAVHRVRWYERPFYALWRWCADRAILVADAAFAESYRYAERADRIRVPRGRSAAVCVYLGGDLEYYRTAGGTPHLPVEIQRASFRAAYVGNMGRNYDLETLLLAFRRVQERHPGAYLVFLGSGELEAVLRRRAGELGANAWFSGPLPHPELVGLLRQMDYGLNTFAAGGNVAYSYKLNDYLLTGVPVINSLDGETREAVERWDLGYNYPAGDGATLTAMLDRACTDRTRAAHQRERVRAFAAAHLDRERIYEPMLAALLAPYSSTRA